jgi:hypothetical protein
MVTMAARCFLRLGIAVLMVLMACSAFAQSAGSLRGTVADKTGAILPGATVTLINEATKFTRTATTDPKGQYFFAAVDPGNYTLKVELSGFKTYEAKGVRISTNATAAVDVGLEVGTQAETVTVTAEREMIRTDTGAREGVITPGQIESISIIGRNPLELLRTLPGVVAPDYADFEVMGTQSGFGSAGQSFSINGARSTNMGVTLDGANMRDIGNNGGSMNVPNNEFVAEVKVQMSNYAAEFGTAAINVQAVTRSGSSEFHGSFYDYLRHHKFSANDRARNYAKQDRPKTKFQYPGFTLSGPILIPGTGFNKNRDKAFFFLGWEWNLQTLAPDAIRGVVPTAGMRQGLFNDFGAGQHLNLNTTVNIPRGFPGAGTPAPNGNLVPYIDPSGLKLMNLYPLPNFQDPDNRYNYIVNTLVDANRTQGVLRLDYNITENTRTYIRLARDTESTQNPRGLWWQPGSIPLPTPIKGTSTARSAVANLTSVLSPTATNEIIFSYSALKLDNGWDDPSKVSQKDQGTSIANPFGNSQFIPDIVVNYTSEASMWAAQDVSNIFAYNGFARATDNFTKVLNTHAVKVGGIVERQYKQQNFQHQNNVQLVFANWGNGSTGNEFADLLVGRPAQAVVGQPSAIGHFVAWNYEFYAQDSWKATKNFTLEYGLRVGKWTNNAETNGLGAIFDPSRYNPSAGTFLDAQKRQLNGVAYASEVGNDLTDARPLLVMPRVNFAWDLTGNGNTVVRGGGGVFYNREQGNAQYNIINVAPNSYAVTLDAGNLSSIGGGQGLTYRTMAGIDPLGQVGGTDLGTMSIDKLDWPRMYQVSASVARRIPWHQTFEVGYVGTFGRHLAAQFQINSVAPGTFLSGQVGNSDLSVPVNRANLTSNVINSRRPFPTLQNVNIFQPVGRSNYNALQLTLSRQTGAFTYLAAYTYSKFKGTVGNDFAQIDPLDPARSYGLLLGDRPHNLAFSWTARLGDPVQGSALGKALLNGWNLSGVSTYISGWPIRLGFSGDLSTDQAEMAWFGTKDFLGYSRDFSQGSIGAITPTYTCDPTIKGARNHVGDKVLDIKCVGIPAFGQSGPFLAPHDLRSPARNFHDLTVFKDFRFGQGDKRVQVRAGIFNLFNQAYPIAPAGPGGNTDIDIRLEATCNRRLNGVPNGQGGTSDNVCDPTGGYTFTQNTIDNFGKILTKRGRRVIEFALRLFF